MAQGQDKFGREVPCLWTAFRTYVNFKFYKMCRETSASEGSLVTANELIGSYSRWRAKTSLKWR